MYVEGKPCGRVNQPNNQKKESHKRKHKDEQSRAEKGMVAVIRAG